MAGVQSTSQQRHSYGPACEAREWRGAQEAWDACAAAMRKHGYALRAADTGSRNCRVITGTKLPKGNPDAWSLHAFFIACTILLWNLGKSIAGGLACDFNWQTNPYGPRLVTDMPRAMIDEILAFRTNSGAPVFGWGGHYAGNKDAMHIEIVCTPADLATGIAGSPPTTPTNEDDMTAILAKGADSPEWWIINEVGKRYVPTVGHAEMGALQGLWKGSDANKNVINQAFVNEMPTIPTQEWISKVMQDQLKARSGLDNAEIIKAVNAHNPTVQVTDAQINTIAAALKAQLDTLKSLNLGDADKADVAKLTAQAVIAEIAS